MIKKLLIVFLVYIAANLIAGYFIVKENEWTYKQSYLKAIHYPHDWYLIGSSRTWLGIDSKILSAEFRRPVYDLSCSAFFMPTNWQQLESFIGGVTKKKVIVELAYNITKIDYHPTLASKAEYVESYYSSMVASGGISFEYLGGIMEKVTNHFQLKGILQEGDLRNKYDEWGEGTDPVFQLPHRPTQSTNLHKRSGELKNNYKIVLATGKSNDYYLTRLKHLIDIARENENEIYFYLPTTLNETEAEMLASVWPYIPLSNRIMTYEDPRFFQLLNEDFLFDDGHLNKKGSELLTDIIVQQLRFKNSTFSTNTEPTASPAALLQK